MATPTSRYRVSIRTYSACLPAVEYGPDDTVVTVEWNGELRFKKRRYKVSNPLRGQPVAIRPDETQDGLYDVFFVHHKLMQIDLRTPSESGA
jgi:hypothetical protein